jgi:hypothetical protein
MADLGEHATGSPARHVDRALHPGRVGAQERTGRLLIADGVGNVAARVAGH